MAEHSIKSTLETVAGYIGEEVKDVLDEKEDIFRVDTMPVASADCVGKIVQFTGTTNANYTNGFFYKCVAHEEESGGEIVTTYAWENTLVQSGGDSRIQSEVLSIGVKTDETGFRPYIRIDVAQVIPAFADASLDVIALIASLYYQGEITLAQVQETWSVGDSKTISVNSEDVTLKIVDFDHDVLVDSIGETENAFMTLGFELADNRALGSVSGAWAGCAGRTYCNETVYNGLPSTLKDVVKTVTKSHNTSTEDKVFIPSIVEYIGRTIYKSEAGVDNTYGAYSPEGGGSRYALYATANIRSKTMIASSTVWRRFGSGMSNTTSWQAATAGNGGTYVDDGGSSGFMPHFCI